MTECIFLNAAGTTLFTRSDMETGHWVQEEMSVNATFPYNPEKVIERGQRIAFRDPATDVLQVFEIRSVSTYEPDAYQQITAEHIAISELQDEHIDHGEITSKTASQALSAVLAGTLWSVGTNTASGTQSADIARGSVWQAVCTIKQNWNVYITPRVVISSAGVITGRYLDIAPAGGTWNGLRLSIRKNMYDPVVTYNDEDVLTALYGYGGTVEVTHSGSDDTEAELTFADQVWTATSEHPAKPSGQTYLEWPEKTALYGRNGRPRFGYYQNANIKDPAVLLQKTWEALKRTCDPKISISGTCADLHRLGYADEPLTLHSMALVEVEETGESFYKEVIRLEVDLVDPDGSRPDIGDYIPNIVYISRETNERASGRGGGGGRGQTNAEAEQSDTFAEFEKSNSMIGMVVGTRNGGYYVKAGEIALAINETGEPGSYESTAYITADHINISGTSTAYTLAGALHVDAQGKLIIDNAGGMYVERTEQGVTSQFGVWDQGNLTGLTIAQLVNGETTAYLNADHINISGTSTVRLMADQMEVDANGKLVITSSGGLYVERTEQGVTSTFGVFDNGNLTGGVIVQKVNGSTGTYISGDHVNISATNTAQTIAGAMEMDASGNLVIKEGAGLYVQHTSGGSVAKFGVFDSNNLTGGIIVGQINDQSGTFVKIQAAKINLSGYVTTSMLESAFTDAQQINVDQLTINDYLTCLGYNTTWQSETVVTGVSVSKTTQHRWVYLDNVGTQQTNNTTMVTNVTRSTKTINFLGR